MDLKGILKVLYAGNRVTIPFPDAKAREAFRVRLYKAKKEQDSVLTAILDEERQELRFQHIDVTTVSEEKIETVVVKAKFWLESKPTQDFIVEIEPLESDTNHDNRTGKKA